MLFVGIDLAWSSRNQSGISVIDEKGKVLASKTVLTNEEILAFFDQHVHGDALVAIDAPLLVPNETGRRIAETEVGKVFRKYHAGAHPANRQRLSSWTGDIRGETITQLLEKRGFVHDPYVKKKEIASKVIEVYPHPSTVVLFGLETILKYKAKPKRDYPFRWKEFEKYRKYLTDLKRPSLKLPKQILATDITTLRGNALKKFEDELDSIFCAYIVLYQWYFPEKCKVFGNMEGGYIMTPVFER